jgi:hypothetical protein
MKIMLTNTCKKAEAIDDTAVMTDNNYMPRVMRIMEDVFFSSYDWVMSNPGRAIRQGITHLVIPSYLVTQTLRDKFDVFEVLPVVSA